MSETRATLPRRGFLARIAGVLTGGAWVAGAPRRAEAQLADEPYISEIRMFAGNTLPDGWLFCEGQLLPIQDDRYYVLWNLIGTTYGGDGQDTFALPDLRGRAPIHQGSLQGIGFFLGETGGVETVPLTTPQMPNHSHALGASNAPGTSDQPSGRVPARNAAGSPTYGTGADTNLSPNALLSTGGSQPHTNMQPYVAIRFMICYEGIFPSQT